MTHFELQRAVARATGEPIGVIAGRGFQPFDLEASGEVCNEIPEDQYIDWEALESERNVALIEQRSLRNPAIA